MSREDVPEPAATGRVWSDADGDGYSALAAEMIAHVRGWSIFGLVLFFWAIVVLSNAGFSRHVGIAGPVLWLNIPVLSASLWMWRRQFVPLRIGPQPLVGAAARRFARKVVLVTIAVDASVLLERLNRQEGLDWVRGLIGL